MLLGLVACGIRTNSRGRHAQCRFGGSVSVLLLTVESRLLRLVTRSRLVGSEATTPEKALSKKFESYQEISA
jgi:hypothetical protein